MNETKNGPLALVNDLIKKAIDLGASDIHFEPTENNLKIRYRIDGLLCDSVTIHRMMISSILVRIKIMINADIGQQQLPQDGKTNFVYNNKEFDLRVSTIPTIFGEKIVIRILNRDSLIMPLEKLGFDKNQITLFKNMIRKTQGLILATGPTGSGKTTTLYSAINVLCSKEKNIITIEDPVEYQLQGINQIQVNYKSGLTFSRGLRAILRQDPDIIMVGEIRDTETAKIAVQSALTGHLVLSTLHTNDCIGSIARLADMGIEPYLIASSLVGVISQRLLRMSCPKCEKCSYSGYKGRIAVFEMLNISEDIKNLIINRAGKNQIEESVNLKPLYKTALEKAEERLTTREEVERVVGE